MKVGDKIKVVEYPDEFVVGALGVITHIDDDVDDLVPVYIEADLFGAPNPDHPHVTTYLFYEEEIEVVR